jgi:hypothetical protein
MRTNLRQSHAIGGIVVLQLFFASFAAPQDSTLISFKIEDQFETVHTDKDYPASIVIIIGSDKEGSKYNGIWSKAIRDSLKHEKKFDQIRFLRIADLRGVPFFLKGFVKGKFPKERERWVLLDWKGQFAKAYEFEPEACNIVIVDQRGGVAHKTHGQNLDHQKLAVLYENIRKLLEDIR